MSQFDALFKTTNEKKTQSEKKPESKEKVSREKKKTSSPPSSTSKTVAPPVAKAEKSRAGKSSNPDYTQVLTYIRRDTHNRVKAALIFDDQRRDLSDLVEELLANWVKKDS